MGRVFKALVGALFVLFVSLQAYSDSDDENGAGSTDQEPKERIWIEGDTFSFLGQPYTLQIIYVEPAQESPNWRMMRMGKAPLVWFGTVPPSLIDIGLGDSFSIPVLTKIASREIYAKRVIRNSQAWVIEQHQRRGGAIEGSAANHYIQKALTDLPDPFVGLGPDLTRPHRRPDDYIRRRSRIVTLTRGHDLPSDDFVSTIKIVESTLPRVYSSALTREGSAWHADKPKADSLQTFEDITLIEIENLATAPGDIDYFEFMWRTIAERGLTELGPQENFRVIEIKCVESLMPLYLGLGFVPYAKEGDFIRMRMNAASLPKGVDSFFGGRPVNLLMDTDDVLARQREIMESRAHRVSMIPEGIVFTPYRYPSDFTINVMTRYTSTFLEQSPGDAIDVVPATNRRKASVGRCALFAF